MSYGVIASVVAAIAGVAVLQTFAQTPIATSPRPKMVAAAKAPAAATHGALLSTARPPVPVLLAHRPAIASVAATASRAEVPEDSSAVTRDDVGGEKTARAAIERDGYKAVRLLTRRPDGTWTGQALRGTTEIAVTVDARGDVSAN